MATTSARGGPRPRGKLVPAARVTWDDDARTVEIENYAFEPVRLGEVRVLGPGE